MGTGISTQERNSALVALLTPEFQGRNEPQFSWSRACAIYQALPGLRGFWPMSSVAHTNPQGLDLSGNGLHLTNNNGALFGYTGLIPHVTFNGTTRYLSHADGGAANAFDITGVESYIEIADRGFAFYSWSRFDVAASASEYVMAKWNTGGNQRSYRLFRQADGTVRGSVSLDGTAVSNVSTTATLSALTWYFLAMQFDPANTELAVWVGSTSAGLVETSGVGPASIFDGTAQFAIGAESPPNNYHDGRQSMDALCASFHSDSIIKAVFNQTKSMYGVV